MTSGVYIIRGPNNGAYIGSSVDINVRWRQHKWALKNNRHTCTHLQRAWNKHGEVCFSFEVIEIVGNTANLLKAEQHWLDWLYDTLPHHCIYNKCRVAGNTLGVKFSDEVRRKLSEMAKKRIRKPLTEEHKQKIGKASRERRHTEEARQKMREARKNRSFPSEETRRKMSLNSKRRPDTDELKRRAFTRSGGRVYTLISPTDRYYPDIIDVTNFARQHDLDPSCLLKMLKGSPKHSHHHGWTGFCQSDQEG